MAVELIIEDARWDDLGLANLVNRACVAVLTCHSLSPDDWDVAVLACDDARIANLNAQFRGKAQPTNVLSWPSEERAPAAPGAVPSPPDPDADPELGDLAIAYDTCLREADAANIAFADHVTHLLVHGTLHLLGYDHETDEDAARMEPLEVEILATLGVPNPY